MSSKMSTVQIVVLVLLPPAQWKSFPIFLGMPVSCCHLLALWSSHQGCQPRKCDLICPLQIFSLICVSLRAVIKNNINSNLRLHLGCKCNPYFMVQFELKHYIKTKTPFFHSLPTTSVL